MKMKMIRFRKKIHCFFNCNWKCSWKKNKDIYTKEEQINYSIHNQNFHIKNPNWLWEKRTASFNMKKKKIRIFLISTHTFVLWSHSWYWPLIWKLPNLIWGQFEDRGLALIGFILHEWKLNLIVICCGSCLLKG